jgi:2-oxoisovalerate dehydrogenase E2 component (dihydrolipoyl transacylase)
MAHEFRMPDIGEGLTEAEIVAWLVREGDVVVVDQPIVEVETAKTTVEIPAPHAGTILKLIGTPGDTVDVGDVLFVIGTPGDAGGAPDATPQAAGVDDSAAATRPEATPSTGDRRIHAMPVVRKLARDLGVDLTTIEGSGSDGAITRTDVERAAAAAGDRADRVVPMTGVRRAISAHMTESWRTIPHVTVQAEIRAEALLDKRGARPERPLPVESILALAVMPLLRIHPEFNAAVDTDGVIHHGHINLGFAVDTDEGLKVVVVRDADRMSFSELTERFEHLAAAAIDHTATPGDLTGQTFTISNIGALGGGHGTPIIPLGTTAILSIGRARHRPVVEDGDLAIGMVAPLDLSYDHRLIDGSLGQRFLGALVAALEAP